MGRSEFEKNSFYYTAPCNLRSGVMEWSRGVEWSLEWSGVRILE